MPSSNVDEPQSVTDRDRLNGARISLIEVIDGAEPHEDNRQADEPDGLAKVGGDGLSVELRLNGETIPLDGKDVNHIVPDAFRSFMDTQKRAIEAGDMDDAIGRALAAEGPGKALIRVRALDPNDVGEGAG